MRNSVSIWVLISLLTLCSACGPKLKDVTGSISVDGAPPQGAVIMYHPTDPENTEVATSVAGADGKFKVNCLKRSGIPPGNYTITVYWPDPSVKPSASEAMMGLTPDTPDLLEGKFSTLAGSKLTVKVTDDMKELPPIDIKTK
jgi:hypothetical protein